MRIRNPEYIYTLNVSNEVNRNSNINAARYDNVDKTISLTVTNAKLWIKLTMLGAGTVYPNMKYKESAKKIRNQNPPIFLADCHP